MDINYAHYMMGHMGETALRAMLNHHNIKATGVFHNCESCMKWKAQNKPVNKEAMQVKDCILMLVDPFHYQWEEKSFGYRLKMNSVDIHGIILRVRNPPLR
jgi:hypothetical protein